MDERQGDHMYVKLIAVIIMGCPAALGQVASDFDITHNPFGEDYFTNRSLFRASVSFDKLPSPLDTAEMIVTLTVLPQYEGFPQRDWVLHTNCPKFATIDGDTVMDWPAPHNEGDQKQVTVRFVTPVSGFQSLTVYEAKLGEFGYQLDGIAIGWCLDENGILQYLGPAEGPEYHCAGVIGFFFANGRINLSGTNDEVYTFPFAYSLQTDRAVRADDTVTFEYTLRAQRMLPQGFTAEVHSSNLHILSISGGKTGPIIAGDVIQLAVSAIPLAVRDEHNINLELNDVAGVNSDTMASQQFIGATFVLGNDGAMRFLGTNNLSISERFLSSALPRANPGEFNSSTVIQ